jgi:hypothetical protein
MITEEMYLLAKKVIESYESKQLNIPVVQQRYNMEWRKAGDVKLLFKSITLYQRHYPNESHRKLTTPSPISEIGLLIAGRCGYRITLMKEWKENSNCDYLIEWYK